MRTDITTIRTAQGVLDELETLWRDRLDRFGDLLAQSEPGATRYPATFVEHDLTPGASVSYFMTSPEGDRSHGWWKITTVDWPRTLTFDDGFADANGAPNPDMPVMAVRVDIADIGAGRTRMTVSSTFASTEHMHQVLEMGAEEGMRAAMGQIDAILEESSTPA